MTFYPWPEIEAFHQVRKFTHHYPELVEGGVVTYRPKVKLHGTNAGIQIHKDGTVIAQSRTNNLTGGHDNMGFAAWVEANKEFWAEKAPTDGVVLFGEWCGKGIQSGVAVSEIPKTFAIFAAQSMDYPDVVFYNPDALEAFVPMPGGHPLAHVLPWAGSAIEVDWRKSSEELEVVANLINEHVLAIEACDPWVEATFGIKGVGEGLVYYPHSHEGMTNLKNLMFKAKGAKHRVVAAPKAATVDPMVAASQEAFAEMVVTEARLEQGMGLVGSPDKKLTGKFVGWIVGDIQKECQAELEASGLTWKQVAGAVGGRASKWWLSKCGL